MPTHARGEMEARFGADFSRVRIHTGSQAAADARRLQARAFTVGHHVVFGEDRFEPGTDAGRHLLAHELAHVLQQGTARQSRVDPFADCGAAADCPPREAGEVTASQAGGMDVLGVDKPNGMLVANFAVGRAAVKQGLAGNARFVGYVRQVRAHPEVRFAILGFTDCEGDETSNTSLRGARAESLRMALPADLHAQITAVGGAPLGDCMQSNATAQERRLNRSAFLQETGAEYDFEDMPLEGAPPAPSTLYGVTSPASQFFVRTSPEGERIGMLTLREMHVEVLRSSGTHVDNLWLEVRFSPADMDAVIAEYAAYMEPQRGRLGGLQTRQTELRSYIRQMQARPGMEFETRPQLEKAQEELGQVQADIQMLRAHAARLQHHYTGTIGWVGAAALGVVAMHYDTFLDLVDAFDAAHAGEPLRDRLTRLRQFGEGAKLEGDTVVGRGGDLPNRVMQSDRPVDTSRWQLLLEAKQIRMPNGEFVDAHHFILGLDALALPAIQQAANRRLYVRMNLGESFSAATWSGDVGGAVGDYVVHRSRDWEQANTSEDNAERRDFYFRTRAPDMDLLADIDAWGAYEGVPLTNTDTTSFTSLRGIIEAHYGFAGQSAQEYEAQVAPGRRQGVNNFLCHYGFTRPTGLLSQRAAVERVREQVTIFGRAWYDRNQGKGTSIFGHMEAADRQIRDASEHMTNSYLEWLERLGSRVGLRWLSCGE